MTTPNINGRESLERALNRLRADMDLFARSGGARRYKLSGMGVMVPMRKRGMKTNTALFAMKARLKKANKNRQPVATQQGAQA